MSENKKAKITHLTKPQIDQMLISYEGTTAKGSDKKAVLGNFNHSQLYATIKALTKEDGLLCKVREHKSKPKAPLTTEELPKAHKNIMANIINQRIDKNISEELYQQVLKEFEPDATNDEKKVFLQKYREHLSKSWRSKVDFVEGSSLSVQNNFQAKALLKLLVRYADKGYQAEHDSKPFINLLV